MSEEPLHEFSPFTSQQARDPKPGPGAETPEGDRRNRAVFAQPTEDFARPAEVFARPIEDFSQPVEVFARPVEAHAHPAEHYAQIPKVQARRSMNMLFER